MNIKTIIKVFSTAQNDQDAQYMKSYMKGLFHYYGIKSDKRRALSKPFIKAAQSLPKSEVIAKVLELYELKEREMHHLGLEICIPYFKKNTDESDIIFFESLAKKNQWWDTIDVIAPKLMAHYFLTYPNNRDFYVTKWLATGDKWLVRCALLFQLKYKTKTDLGLLFETILSIPPTKEFFINKAIGWMLRENSRLFPEAVVDFVTDNENYLSNLSKKEALRLLK
ncbi:MAG: DNA alkylation repair protein [Crocinitomicaceae bacterium]